MIIVTGGAGFIGSNILAGLEKQGYKDIVVVDWLGNGDKWKNIAKRELAAIIAPENMFDYMGKHKDEITAVIHMGAISTTTETDVDLITRSNFELSWKLWEFCRDNEKQFIYASSAATYGDGSQGFKDDNDLSALNALRPLNPYGWSKALFDRKVAREVLEGRKLPKQYVGLKFFNVYGPNEYHTAPINAWLKEKIGGAFNNAVEIRPVPEGALFLAGAAYFDGEWRFPFEKENTKLLNFYNMDGSIGKVMMMSQELVTDYYEDAVMQAVRLYFASGDYLTVFLPRAASDFNKFAANIGERRLKPEFNRERVEVSLPQFELFYKISDFRSLYALFGVQKIFLPDNYNFAKMINYDFPAYVEEVALQTKIRVRETRVRSGDAGGNGAAETVRPSAVTGLSGKDVKEFRANRPFIFMVNEGDIIGVYVKGCAEAAETAGKEDFQKTGTVYVREKKNGTPAWYEDKNQRGDFILRNDLKDKSLSDGNVSEAVLF